VRRPLIWRVTVTLVDTGIDATHPDLHHNVLPGIDLVDPTDGDGREPGGERVAGCG
jgi:subtilisin family serine protease